VGDRVRRTLSSRLRTRPRRAAVSIVPVALAVAGGNSAVAMGDGAAAMHAARAPRSATRYRSDPLRRRASSCSPAASLTPAFIALIQHPVKRHEPWRLATAHLLRRMNDTGRRISDLSDMSVEAAPR